MTLDPSSLDIRHCLYFAARDGKVNWLQKCLEENPPDLVRTAAIAKTNGATPLVMASKNGHYDAVKFLIEELSADIEQVGNVQFDGETIEGAPSLWCAAAAGHVDVVKYLIKSGAQVNSTTKTKSTPLRAACYDGHLQIVQYLIENDADVEIANRHGHTCLMIACYKGHFKIAKYLIEQGANVNRKSVKGNTALHDCAESGSLDIMQLLLENGAQMEKDSYGATPLIAAALTGHTPIVELIISRENGSPQDRIDALELLGATFVDKKRDMMTALDYWRRSLMLRLATGLRVSRRTATPPTPCYTHTLFPAADIESVEQLEELFSDPDEMRMQALVVRERILGPAHPDTSYYIRYRGAVYADTGNYDKCISLWMYALNMQQAVLETLNPIIQSSLLSFAELFSFMMSKSVTKVKFCDLYDVFLRALRQLQYSVPHVEVMTTTSLGRGNATVPNRVTAQPVTGSFLSSSSRMYVMSTSSCPSSLLSAATTHLTPSEADISSFHQTLVIVLHFVGLLCRLQPYMTAAEEFEMKRAVFKLVRFAPRGKHGWTPLHLACLKDSPCPSLRFPLCEFPMPEMVSLLLEVGASPNDLDDEGNTPLHSVALSNPVPRTVVTMLLSYGAHLDIRNKRGKTPLDLLSLATFIPGYSTSAIIHGPPSEEGQQHQQQPPSPHNQEQSSLYSSTRLDIFPLRFLSLQCLAARAVVRHGIPFSGVLSADLEKFVRIH